MYFFVISWVVHSSLLFFRIVISAGNVKFRRLLERHLDDYTEGDDTFKMIMVDCLTDQMRSALGVRFLKPAPGNKDEWVEVSDRKTIRSKCYQAFRNLRASYKRIEHNMERQLQSCRLKTQEKIMAEAMSCLNIVRYKYM